MPRTGAFGTGPAARSPGAPTHAVVVNLDYRADAVVGLRGPAGLEVFDAAAGRWSRAGENRAELRLSAGGGRLVRIRP